MLRLLILSLRGILTGVMTAIPRHKHALTETGFVLPVPIIGESGLPAFRAEADRLLEKTHRSGARNIFADSPLFRDWAADFCNGDCLRDIQDADWQIVRGILFNKSPEQNWSLRWHQDSALAFERQLEVPGYGPWSVKQGILHAISPATLLEKIVTLRLHLDDTDATTGALEILPKTHRNGRLSRQRVADCVTTISPVICALHAGQAMLMRPLLIHRSGKAKVPRQRRVIHVEFAPGPAPAPLNWAGGDPSFTG